MKFYEVVMELISGTRKIGKTSMRLAAKSRFEAAIQAEKLTDADYGESVYSHALKVERISSFEYGHRLAA